MEQLALVMDGVMELGVPFTQGETAPGSHSCLLNGPVKIPEWREGETMDSFI